MNGDRNTSHFPTFVSKWKAGTRTLYILNGQGQVLDDIDFIKGVAISHFQRLFQEKIYSPDTWNILNNLKIPKLSTIFLEWLLKPFTMEEIEIMVFQSHLDSIPGHDGFTFRFY